MDQLQPTPLDLATVFQVQEVHKANSGTDARVIGSAYNAAHAILAQF